MKDVPADAQRLLAHQTSKKEPITVARLDQLVNSKALSMANDNDKVYSAHIVVYI